ncbi:uncharacterized protein LTR77_010105 [Saxophila tyrrhenica]|uniref:Uncharacterized protein n=1 Tax=Saxophila tyrrhenica TaxID=1690608 RepID=A0AAV9NVX9_9PEZI|nr:hypothetical protein LTR77_010105 [Saxophila tyrrhenica]
MAFYTSAPAFAIAKRLYPVPYPRQARTKDLKVICVGLPRNATESLGQALLPLGYNDVSHGCKFWLNGIGSSVQYYELALLRSQNRLPDEQTMRTKYFDCVLGECEATTNIPSVWGVALTNWLHGKFLFDGDFEANAERAYAAHHKRLKEVLEDWDRPHLNRSVEEGWAPLCAFLSQNIPPTPFPSRNVAADFIGTLMKVDEERFRKGKSNAMLVAIAFLSPIAGLAFSWLHR